MDLCLGRQHFFFFSVVMEALKSSGWRLSAESFKPESDNVLREALNSDLKDVGESCVADLLAELGETNSSAATATGQRVLKVPEPGLVLQVGKLRNLSAPKIKEESQMAPRMLKVSLTDGHGWLHGVEVAEKLARLDVNTPPGTKVRLLPGKEIAYISGFLQLRQQHLEVLGGRVEPLVEKWEISRKLAQFTRAKPSGPGGPPPWVPFGKKVHHQQKQKEQQETDKNFKAMATAGGGTKEKEDKDQSKASEEFNSQRQDAIEEAAKQGGKKVFGGGKAEIKEASSKRNRRREDVEQQKGGEGKVGGEREQQVPNEGDRERGGGRRKGRRGREEEDGDYDQQKQPSAGVSLFDFLEKEFPGAHDVPEDRRGGAGGRQKQQHAQGQREENKAVGYGRNREGDGQRGGGHQDIDRHGNRNEKPPRYRNKENHEERGSDRDRRDNRGRQRRDHHGGRSDVGEDRRGGDRRQQHQQQDNFRGHYDNYKPQQRYQNTSSAYSGTQDGGRGGPGGRDGGGGSQRPRLNEAMGNRGGSGEGGGSRGADFTGRNPRMAPGGSSSDRDFGEWSNSTYHNAAAAKRRGDSQQQQQLTSNFESMNIDNRRRHQQNGYQDWGENRYHQGGRGSARREQHYQHQQYHQGQYDSQDRHYVKSSLFSQQDQQHPFGQQQQQHRSHQQHQQKAPHTLWHEGEECLARYWEDKQFYPCVITALAKTTAVVLFKEYGNHEEVLLSDLAPKSHPSGGGRSRGGPGGGAGEGTSQGFIPVTPGLPPAFPQS